MEFFDATIPWDRAGTRLRDTVVTGKLEPLLEVARQCGPSLDGSRWLEARERGGIILVNFEKGDEARDSEEFGESMVGAEKLDLSTLPDYGCVGGYQIAET